MGKNTVNVRDENILHLLIGSMLLAPKTEQKLVELKKAIEIVRTNENVNRRDVFYRTPFDLALSNGIDHRGVLQALLPNSNLKEKNTWKEQALKKAQSRDNKVALRLIKERFP